MIQRGQSFRPSAKVLSKVLGGDTHTRSLSHTRTHIHTHTHTHTHRQTQSSLAVQYHVTQSDELLAVDLIMEMLFWFLDSRLFQDYVHQGEGDRSTQVHAGDAGPKQTTCLAQQYCVCVCVCVSLHGSRVFYCGPFYYLLPRWEGLLFIVDIQDSYAYSLTEQLAWPHSLYNR